MGLLIHDRFEEDRELLCGRYELRDTPLGLFGIELFFLKGLVAPRLVVAFFLMPRVYSL